MWKGPSGYFFSLACSNIHQEVRSFLLCWYNSQCFNYKIIHLDVCFCAFDEFKATICYCSLHLQAKNQLMELPTWQKLIEIMVHEYVSNPDLHKSIGYSVPIGNCLKIETHTQAPNTHENVCNILLIGWQTNTKVSAVFQCSLTHKLPLNDIYSSFTESLVKEPIYYVILCSHCEIFWELYPQMQFEASSEALLNSNLSQFYG